MQLSEDSLQLNLQLSWLLAAEPRVPLGSCLQPRAVCLPLGHQLTLTLSISRLLQAGRTKSSNLRDTVHTNSPKLLQLLHLLTSTSGNSSFSRTIQQIAQLAIQQHEQALLHQFRSLHEQVHQAVLPSWLPTSNQHCFAWQAAAKQSDQALTHEAATSVPKTGPQEASLQHLQQDTADAMAVDVQLPGAQQYATCVAAADGVGDGAGHGDSPPSKRVKLDTSTASAVLAGAATANGSQPRVAGTAAGIALVIQQLKVLEATCDASGLDVRLLQQLLALAAAATAGVGPGANLAAAPAPFTALQEQLQALSVDALQLLMDRVMKSGSSQSTEAVGEATSEGQLAQLLTVAVLPQLQQLKTAAPQALLTCVVAVAKQHLDMLTSVVLQSLLLSPELVAVQGQLLIKLMKEAPAVQARLLQLLLLGSSAALGPNSNTAFPHNVVGFDSLNPLSLCCWNESHVTLLKVLLDTSPELISSNLDGVVTAVKAAATQPVLQKSKVFGQLMMAIVNSYAPMLTVGQLQQLEMAVAAMQTFMTKAVRTKLQQLLKQHTTE